MVVMARPTNPLPTPADSFRRDPSLFLAQNSGLPPAQAPWSSRTGTNFPQLPVFFFVSGNEHFLFDADTQVLQSTQEEEEEEEDLFVFNDTIEGPRAPVVKPGRVTQA